MDEGQLEVASQAALSMPVVAPENDATFSPFGGFAWPRSTRPAAPVGSSKREAHDVAWAITCSAFVETSREADCIAASVAYATHLRREGPVADKLYQKLSTRAGDIVQLSEVEEVLGVRWGEVDLVIGGHARRLDPYFWNMLERAIRNSVTDYVHQLDQTLAVVDGLDPLQRSAGACIAMEEVRRLAAACLCTALLADTDATQMVASIQRAQHAAVPPHVTAAKQVLREQIAGVRALGLLAAAPEDTLGQRLQELEAQIGCLLAQPPRALEDQLKDRRISLLELGAVLLPSSNGLVEPSSRVPPPAIGVRLTVLTRWLDHCRVAVSEACVAAVAALQRAVDRSPLSAEWAGVALGLASQTDPRTREAPLGCIVRWVPPAHLGHDDDPRVVVSQPDANHSALRAARLFRVLLDQARLGLLPARAVRADLLMPIVARFTAEGEVAYGQFVDMNLRPVGVRVSLPYADAHFGFSGRLKLSSVRVSLSDVELHLVTLVPAMNQLTPASRIQLVSYVCRKAVARAQERLKTKGLDLTIEYSATRDRAQGGRVGGVVCEGDGVGEFFDFITWCVNQMRFNAPSFAVEWGLARVSKAAAGHKQ